MRFEKEKMLIEMYPEDAIYQLTIKFLVEKEDYKNPNEENINEKKPFSFSCKIPEDDAQNDLLARFITYLCRKCNHNKYNSLANRICIARLLVFLLQRDNEASPELTSITQKIDETESKELPARFEFIDLDFNKKDPKDTLTKILADFMRIKTGDVSPGRKGSILGRTLSSTGSHLRGAASAVREASPFGSKTRSRKGSIASATPPSPTPPPSLPSSHPAPPPSSSMSSNSILSEFRPLPDVDDELRQTDEEHKPLLKPPALTSTRRSSPPKAPQGQGAFFQRGVLNDPSKDPLKIYQPYEVKMKETEFTTSYEKSNDQMTIFCANEHLLNLLKGILEKNIAIRLFNKNVIQFKYGHLTAKKLNLNMLLPIVFRGLPEAMEQSAKGDMFRNSNSIKKNKKLINDDDADDKTIVLCSWRQCCC